MEFIIGGRMITRLHELKTCEKYWVYRIWLGDFCYGCLLQMQH